MGETPLDLQQDGTELVQQVNYTSRDLLRYTVTECGEYRVQLPAIVPEGGLSNRSAIIPTGMLTPHHKVACPSGDDNWVRLYRKRNLSKPPLIKSSQVVGLRTRIVRIRTIIFPSPVPTRALARSGWGGFLGR